MKSQFIRLAAAVAVALSISACAQMKAHEVPGGEDQVSFNQMYQQAEAALQKASEANNAWSTTEETLDEAKQAAAKADYAAAIKLAERAKWESEMALSQAESQKNAGPTLF